MKIIADRATNWRLEVHCSECSSELELSRDDVRCAAATPADEADYPGYVYRDDGLAAPIVFLCTCVACGARLVLEHDDLPNFIVNPALAVAAKVG